MVYSGKCFGKTVAVKKQSLDAYKNAEEALRELELQFRIPVHENVIEFSYGKISLASLM